MSNISQGDSPIYILHIEDDKGIQALTRRMLERNFKAVVVTVESGDEAMAVMGTRSWAAVVSDWNVSGSKTGGDVYHLVQVEYPAIAPRYVFMSDDKSAAELCDQEGLPYVEKPATQSEICRALYRAMGMDRV